MIKSVKCKYTKQLLEGGNPKKFRALKAQAERKLEILDAAIKLLDLRSPPGNHLEALTGNRLGQYSIRINKQWRICFSWSDGPCDVEITDYH